MEVLCDCCADPFEEDETRTCHCGQVVCDGCFEGQHYECEEGDDI